jgi:hypothetical protein
VGQAVAAALSFGCMDAALRLMEKNADGTALSCSRNVRANAIAAT